MKATPTCFERNICCFSRNTFSKESSDSVTISPGLTLQKDELMIDILPPNSEGVKYTSGRDCGTSTVTVGQRMVESWSRWRHATRTWSKQCTARTCTHIYREKKERNVKTASSSGPSSTSQSLDTCSNLEAAVSRILDLFRLSSSLSILYYWIEVTVVSHLKSNWSVEQETSIQKHEVPAGFN